MEMNYEKQEQPNYFAVIPASIRFDNRLKANEKLLYGEIVALLNKEGYCCATNQYFAKLYETHPVTVSRWINHLVECGYIKSEMIYKENSTEIEMRKLTITR